jgi:hypothetical protein
MSKTARSRAASQEAGKPCRGDCWANHANALQSAVAIMTCVTRSLRREGVGGICTDTDARQTCAGALRAPRMQSAGADGRGVMQRRLTQDS